MAETVRSELPNLWRSTNEPPACRHLCQICPQLKAVQEAAVLRALADRCERAGHLTSAFGHESNAQKRGGAIPLRPDSSDINLFCYGQSVVDLNPQVAHRALNFLVFQQKLNCPQVASPAVNEGRFGSAQ
jgi:hypothetical protein